jgi:hypothetical protein
MASQGRRQSRDVIPARKLAENDWPLPDLPVFLRAPATGWHPRPNHGSIGRHFGIRPSGGTLKIERYEQVEMSAELLTDKRSQIDDGRYLWLRSGITLLAAAILYQRLPGYFNHPQFWAEDGLAWIQTHIYGTRSLWFPLPGYLVVGYRLVALAATLFPVKAAPAVYIYGSIVETLAIVWMATSRRLLLPMRPIIALAIVTPVQGIFTLGTLANTQWILPVGGFLLLFMAPAAVWVTALEAGFVLVVSLTGPFSIFLAPLFAMQTVLVRKETAQCRRMALLAAVVTLGALAQILTITTHLDEALAAGDKVPFTLATLFTMPVHQTFVPLGRYVVSEYFWIPFSVVIAAAAIIFAARKPYRAQKIFMLAFAGMVVVAGMQKSGVDFDESFGLRYFYIAAVMVPWFICCVARTNLGRVLCTTIAIAFGVVGTDYSRNSEMNTIDLRWSYWSDFVYSGLPFTYASSPPGWHLNIPASPEGPLSSYAGWPGKKLANLTAIDGRCDDNATFSITPLNATHFSNVPHVNDYEGVQPRWVISGTENNKAIQLIVITNRDQIVQGFGFPTGYDDQWISTVAAEPGEPLSTYGIRRNGESACLTGATGPLVGK